MATRTLLVGSVLAAALLAGCGSSSTGTASTASTTSTTGSTSSSTSATTSSSTEKTSTTEMSTEMTTEKSTDMSSEDTGSVTPADLDDTSKTWFATMCTGFAGAVTQMTGAMSGGAIPTGADANPKDQQAALVTVYNTLATAFTNTAQSLTGLPAPTVGGGDKLASDLITAFGTLGSALTASTATFASAAVTDQASLQTALTALTTELTTTGQQLTTSLGSLKTGLSPAIQAAVQKLPECSVLAG